MIWVKFYPCKDRALADFFFTSFTLAFFFLGLGVGSWLYIAKIRSYRNILLSSSSTQIISLAPLYGNSKEDWSILSKTACTGLTKKRSS